MRETVEVNLFFYHGLIPYDLYSEWYSSQCVGQSLNPPPRCTQLLTQMQDAVGPYTPDNAYQNSCTGNGTLDISETVTDCYTVEDGMTTYLNRDDVQQAIHAVKPIPMWFSCTPHILLNYTTDWPSMLPYYQDIFSLRLLICASSSTVVTLTSTRAHTHTHNCA